ncbi:MAG: hypothetical protein MK161_17395, partial [Pirellulales bacterium]|nr:hypothetical protein [Pirellulales bacterium]
SCSARGCHGLGGDNQFLLHRSMRGRQPSQRVTLRNLQSVLRWIDQENVHKSPLLHFAETPHFTAPQRDAKRGTWAPDSLTARRRRRRSPSPPRPSQNAMRIPLSLKRCLTGQRAARDLFSTRAIPMLNLTRLPHFVPETLSIRPFLTAAIIPTDPYRLTKNEGDGVSR